MCGHWTALRSTPNLALPQAETQLDANLAAGVAKARPQLALVTVGATDDNDCATPPCLAFMIAELADSDSDSHGAAGTSPLSVTTLRFPGRLLRRGGAPGARLGNALAGGAGVTSGVRASLVAGPVGAHSSSLLRPARGEHAAAVFLMAAAIACCARARVGATGAPLAPPARRRLRRPSSHALRRWRLAALGALALSGSTQHSCDSRASAPSLAHDDSTPPAATTSVCSRQFLKEGATTASPRCASWSHRQSYIHPVRNNVAASVERCRGARNKNVICGRR